MTDQGFDGRQGKDVLLVGQRHGLPRRPGPGGPADAMDVIFHILGGL